MTARVKTYFGEWGLFTWLFVFTSLFQIRFCFTTNEVLGFKSHTEHKAKKPLQSVYLLAGLLVTAEEDDGTDDDKNGGNGNHNTNDST